MCNMNISRSKKICFTLRFQKPVQFINFLWICRFQKFQQFSKILIFIFFSSFAAPGYLALGALELSRRVCLSYSTLFPGGIFLSFCSARSRPLMSLDYQIHVHGALCEQMAKFCLSNRRGRNIRNKAVSEGFNSNYIVVNRTFK